MAIAAIMVDVDGVVVAHQTDGGWADHIERDLGLSVQSLQKHFFALHWQEVVCGHAGLRARLAPVLLKIAPHLTCDQLIDYWFANDAHLNHELLSDLAVLRQSGIAIHLATVQEHERASYLWAHVGLRDHVDAIHYSADLGCTKPDIAFYKMIEQRTGLEPTQIFFIDDRSENVEGALHAGWAAALWTPKSTLPEVMAGLSLPQRIGW